MTDRYQILLADCPWQFRRGGDYGMRTADSHYPTMSVEAICRMDPWLMEITEPIAALFLWSTCATLPDALRVMAAWGFAYRTVAFTWVKLTKRPLNSRRYLAFKAQGTPVVFYSESPDRHARPHGVHFGMGSYSRQSTELVLLGTRGSIERLDRGIRQTIFAPVREHSRKPDQTYELIELMYGPLRRLELFARHERIGWDAWGDELEKETTNVR